MSMGFLLIFRTKRSNFYNPISFLEAVLNNNLNIFLAEKSTDH